MIISDPPPAAATLDLSAPPTAGVATPRAVAIGVFDGVHRGHRELLRRLRRSAHRCGASPTVLTFHPHPRAVVGKGEAPRALCSLRRRVQLLESTSEIDECVVLPFTTEVAGLEPGEFVEEVLVRRLGARHVLIGANFRFGRARAGDIDTLRSLGERHGFTVELADLDPLTSGGTAHVSSTLIRERLAGGDVAFARWALGRPHEIDGHVIALPGGRPSPPAIVEPEPGVCVPAVGDYLGRMRWRGLSGTASALTVGDGGEVTAWDLAQRPDPACPATVQFLARASSPADRLATAT